jgi:hypothetical protein
MEAILHLFSSKKENNMTNVNIASNEPQKPVNPSTPANPQQQSQNDPKPASDKPANQQK